MAAEIEQLKQLQVGMNAAFNDLIKSSQDSPKNAGAIAAAKGQIVSMAHMTLGTVLGPAFSIIDFSFQPYAYAALRIALDLKLFEIIDKSISLDEIVQKTKANPVILQRILRAVSSMGYLQQTAVTKWEPTQQTQLLNVPSLRDFLIVHFDLRMTICGEFPEWLKKRGYQTTGSADDNMVTEVLGVPLWEWHDQNPEYSVLFDSAMSIQEGFPKDMIPRYPFSGDMGELSTDSDSVTLVDVGGGFGQAIKSIRAEHPSLEGRFIVQDLPKTIKRIDAVQAKKEGLEPMVHDFFTPQTIKGAKYYYFRDVLHNWNDEPSIKILEATRVAMKDTPQYSRLLIHEFVLPDVGCGHTEAMFDLMLMQICDGMERTESQWHELLRRTGFSIVKFWRADVGNIAIIEAVVA